MSAVLDNYADQVRKGLKVSTQVSRIPHCALGLTGEAGEVADVIKKSQYAGGSLDIPKLEEELGDVLWYLQALCNFCGLTIEQLAVLNIQKLAARRPDDYTPIP
jgi:NTP pyrophosphatase (non-canonical NTP hydrolase)